MKRSRYCKGPSSIIEFKDKEITIDIDSKAVKKCGWKFGPPTSTVVNHLLQWCCLHTVYVFP